MATIKQQRIDELGLLDKAIAALEADPSSSQSISTPTGGSQSVTYRDIDALIKRRDRVIHEIAELQRVDEGAQNDLGLGYPAWIGG